jgi:Co/Zn/Cd efflux system component
MDRSEFAIPQMDCPSEENLIRMKLDGYSGVKHLEFDLENRKLVVFHESPLGPIERALESLQLGSKLVGSGPSQQSTFAEQSAQRKLLWTVLVINALFFLVEMATGWISGSMGLVADSLDMLADAIVYGLSLWAVGGTVFRKKRIARLAGYFQITLAVLGFLEIVRRFLGLETVPDFSMMITVSFLALLANGFCLYLLQRSRSKGEVHMKASLIFTSNDVIINLGVILAGVLVSWTGSGVPDLVVGAVVFVLVIRGAIRMLNLGR